MNSDHNKQRNALAGMKSALVAADIPLSPLFAAVRAALLAAVAAGAPVFGTVFPFGLALAAAAPSGLTAAAAALGTVLGSVMTPQLPGIAIAALLLFFGRVAAGAFLAGGQAATVPEIPAPQGAEEAVPLAPQGSILRKVLRFAELSASGVIRPALGAVAAALAGTVTMLVGSEMSVVRVLAAVVLTPLCTVAFMPSRHARLTPVGQMLFVFAATRALSLLALPFGAGVLFAFSAPLYLAYRGGNAASGGTSIGVMGMPVTAGLIAGVAIDIGAAPVYALSALLGGGLMSFSPALAVCASYVLTLTVSFLGGGVAALSAVMPECTLAAAVLVPLFRFSLIPRERAAGKQHTDAAAVAALRATRMAEQSVTHMGKLSAAFGDLSGVFSAVSERLRRPSVLSLKDICESATEARCSACENRVLCWEREFATTSDTLCRLTAALHKDGRVTAAVIPPALAARCPHMDGILTEVNDACKREADAAARGDKTEIVSDNLASFSDILEEAAASVRTDCAPDRALSGRLSRAWRQMDTNGEGVTVYGTRRRSIVARTRSAAHLQMGSEDICTSFEKITGGRLTLPEYHIDGTAVTVTMESRAALTVRHGACTCAAGEGSANARPVSGDVAAQFQSEDGRFFSIITDGMGTGGEAAVTARLSVTVLTKLLTARVSLKSALTMLNGYLRARNVECSAGIDVMELDLFESEARFVKSGAAPSFVVRQGRLYRLASKTVPIGILRALDAEMIRFALQPGDTIVMLSDGVTTGFDEASWLCDLLATPSMIALPPRELARKIVAAARTASEDDITATVVQISAAR